MKKDVNKIFACGNTPIPWEVIIAIGINILIAGLFFVFKPDNPESVALPTEIAVDISDFTPPKPKEMKIPQAAADAAKATKKSIADLGTPKSSREIARNSMADFTPQPSIKTSLKDKTAYERKQDLTRIEQNIRVFDGINYVQSGLAQGALPAGHQTGASFSGRGNGQGRSRLLKKHGGGENTESAVEKALKYLSAQQNSSGSWGSAESFKTGDAAALSSLALLAFFSHGETFQSEAYGETIRKGCDFLIELANTPNIEYAGHGFGHAILIYALAEGYAVTGSISLRNALEQRLRFIISKQNKFGSFAMNYDNTPQAPPTAEQLEDPQYKEIVIGEAACDLSLLGWHIQALTAAKNSGVESEGLDKSLELATEALVKIHQAKRGGFSSGINMKRFDPNDNMNPVGLLGLYFLNSGRSSPARRAEKLLKEVAPPKWRRSGSFPLYRWYYQTQAMFQAERGRGRHWKEWNENLKQELLKAQQDDGSWPMPGGDTSFRVRNKTDLSIYSSSLCALMLQVYYRYLTSYSIAENDKTSSRADDYDLGGEGLITRLPGGADPMAAVILGIGVKDMEPIRFGKFNGVPADNKSLLAVDEFKTLASMRSTIAVRKTADWPQNVQPSQRIALLLDELLPRNFKGHLRLLVGVVGDRQDAFDNKQSFEAVLNGKRLFNAMLLGRKQLVEIVIPNDVMQPFGNILQLRNNGKAVLAFDAAEISAVNKVGQKLFLFADNEELKYLPNDLRGIFSTQQLTNEYICKLSGYAENRQLLPEITAYDPSKSYIGEYSAMGSERMGNEFQLHYLRTAGREIVDWLAGGGSGVKIKQILTGGKFYDSAFKTEYPALAALKRIARLFEGTPYKLSSQVYPKYGEKPSLFCSSIAAYNAPGVATIVVAKRFPVPQESELVAIVPWNGPTAMIIEQGFLPEKTAFIGFAPLIERESKNVNIENNIFRCSMTFPEMTIIRLVKKGAKDIDGQSRFNHQYVARKEIKFDYFAVKNVLSQDAEKLKKHTLRQAGGFAAPYGQNASFSIIPATVVKEGMDKFTPAEKKSISVSFRTNAEVKNRFDSVYLSLGSVPNTPEYLSFYVYTRAAGLKKRERMSTATLRFALGSKLFSVGVPIERWRRIVLPLDKINVAWQNLRILEPVGIFSRNLQSISFEINDVGVLTK